MSSEDQRFRKIKIRLIKFMERFVYKMTGFVMLMNRITV